MQHAFQPLILHLLTIVETKVVNWCAHVYTVKNLQIFARGFSRPLIQLTSQMSNVILCRHCATCEKQQIFTKFPAFLLCHQPSSSLYCSQSRDQLQPL